MADQNALRNGLADVRIWAVPPRLSKYGAPGRRWRPHAGHGHRSLHSCGRFVMAVQPVESACLASTASAITCHWSGPPSASAHFHVMPRLKFPALELAASGCRRSVSARVREGRLCVGVRRARAQAASGLARGAEQLAWLSGLRGAAVGACSRHAVALSVLPRGSRFGRHNLSASRVPSSLALGITLRFSRPPSASAELERYAS